MNHSPLDLYYFLGGTVIHSDDGPEAARQRMERNEGYTGPLCWTGAIQPDSSVTFDNPELFIPYFNVRTRSLQPENVSEGLVFAADELIGPHGFHVYAAYNSSPHKLHCFVAQAKLDAYMAAFEAVSA